MAQVLEDRELSLEEHLTELRDRLILVLAVLAALSIAFMLYFSKDILEFFIKDLLPAGTNVIALNPMEYVYMRFLISLLCAAVVALPLIIYETFVFMKPGLFPNERRFFLRVVPSSAALFAAGGAISYYLLIPFSLKFLIGYAENVATPLISLEKFVSFVTFMLFVVGAMFQLPLVVSLMVRTGIVALSELKEMRKYAYPLLFIISLALAPDPTPVTPLLIAFVFILVYELSIILARFIL